MAIGPGSRVGPYEITALIGHGGMGEVWRAHHSALKRDDALKVLPEGFDSSPDRLARFQREAQVLASLNHPNIAHVYGLEDADPSTGSGQAAVYALVMELVDGPTLADRIAQGPIPLDEALPIARQIADALDAAHEQGIVHRDLKPANVKLRPDGTVKVLDFGLAKVMEPATVTSPGHSLSPTITTPAMTQLGMILGTAAYMSPEQAKGKPADTRSDIWSFGCVLYEMLTGRRAFGGEDVSDTLAAVLRSDIDWSALPATTSPSIRQLLRRALERDRRRRLADMADARLELDDALNPPPVAAGPATGSTTSRWLILTGTIIVAAGLVAAALLWTRTPAVPRPIARFSITLPPGEQFTPVEATRHLIALSPDGDRIAFAANGKLHLRARDQLTSTVIAEAGANPFFSPDGQWVGYFANGRLMKVSVNGGAPIELCETLVPFGASWPVTDTILFSQGVGGIWRVPAAGGMPEQLVKVDANERAHGPQLLPDGRTLIYTLSRRGESWDAARIVARPLEGGETRTLVRGGSDARYVSTGHLLYARAANLIAISFHLSRLETTGDPVTLVDDLARSLAGNTGAAQFSLSGDGTLAYVSASSSGLNLSARFVWADRTGRETPISVLPSVYLAPAISPDGTRVAYQTTQGISNDIWTYEFRRGIIERVSTEPGLESDAVWSPDGRRIAYRAEGPEGGPGIFVKNSDGTGSAERLTSGRHVPSSWSRDGTRLLYADFGKDVVTNTGPADLAMVTLSGDRRSETLLTTPVRESNAHFSPNERWIAYEATETGERAIFVRPFPDVSSARWRISSAGGSSAVWAKDGQTLFYRSGQAIMAVAVRGTTPAEWGTPEKVFEGNYFFIEGPEMFDVAADGRFLLLKIGTDQTKATPDSIVVVQNWIEELKRRGPAK